MPPPPADTASCWLLFVADHHPQTKLSVCGWPWVMLMWVRVASSARRSDLAVFLLLLFSLCRPSRACNTVWSHIIHTRTFEKRGTPHTMNTDTNWQL